MTVLARTSAYQCSIKIFLAHPESPWRVIAGSLVFVPVDANDPRAPYLQIADDLRRAIEAGTLAPGERLESGRKLAVQYGVAPMTVQQAIRELRNEGLVVTWQGRGAYVRGGSADDPAVETITSRLDALADALQDLETRVAHLEGGRGRPQARRRDG